MEEVEKKREEKKTVKPPIAIEVGTLSLSALSSSSYSFFFWRWRERVQTPRTDPSPGSWTRAKGRCCSGARTKERAPRKKMATATTMKKRGNSTTKTASIRRILVGGGSVCRGAAAAEVPRARGPRRWTAEEEEGRRAICRRRRRQRRRSAARSQRLWRLRPGQQQRSSRERGESCCWRSGEAGGPRWRQLSPRTWLRIAGTGEREFFFTSGFDSLEPRVEVEGHFPQRVTKQSLASLEAVRPLAISLFLSQR